MRFHSILSLALLALLSVDSSSALFLRQEGSWVAGDRPADSAGGNLAAEAFGHLRAGKSMDDFVEEYLKNFLDEDYEEDINEDLFRVQEQQTNNNTEEEHHEALLVYYAEE